MFERLSMPEKLQTTNNVLEVIGNDPELQKEILVFGFDQERLDEGRSLMEHARVESANEQHQFGQNRKSRDDLSETERKVRNRYMITARIMKKAFEERQDVLISLDLIGQRKPVRPPGPWIDQAWNFYRNITEEMQPELDRFGFTSEQLEKDEAALRGYSEKLATLDEGEGSLVFAKNRRRSAFASLDDWLVQMETVLRIVSVGNPHWYASLGLRSKKRKPSPQPEEPQLPEEPPVESTVNERESLGTWSTLPSPVMERPTSIAVDEAQPVTGKPRPTVSPDIEATRSVIRVNPEGKVEAKEVVPAMVN